MMVPDAQLIAAAVLINHAQAERRTVSKYETHLHHLSSYLESAYGLTFYTAQRKHITLFMAHLAECGGTKPHASRLSCEWCAVRGYPDGRSGPGWSASTRKSYLSAIKFLYDHFACEEDLPSINPAASVKPPRVVVQRQYTPSREEVQKVLDAPGRPRDRLIAHWTFYAPSRRETFVNARWRDIEAVRVARELAPSGTKTGWQGNRTHWELSFAAADGDRYAAARWHEWEQTSFGTSALTGMRRRGSHRRAVERERP